jgi:hypothetical protein
VDVVASRGGGEVVPEAGGGTAVVALDGLFLATSGDFNMAVDTFAEGTRPQSGSSDLGAAEEGAGRASAAVTSLAPASLACQRSARARVHECARSVDPPRRHPRCA